METTTSVPTYETSDFDWLPDLKVFVAECSELRWPPGRPPLPRYNVYVPHSYTFILRSSATGRTVQMVLSKTTFNRDYSGGWSELTFRPTDPSLFDNFRAVICNDWLHKEADNDV